MPLLHIFHHFLFVAYIKAQNSYFNPRHLQVRTHPPLTIPSFQLFLHQALIPQILLGQGLIYYYSQFTFNLVPIFL